MLLSLCALGAAAPAGLTGCDTYFERSGVAVPSDAACYQGLGPSTSFEADAGSTLEFQVVVNGGHVGDRGGLRDVAVVAAVPFAPDGTQADTSITVATSWAGSGTGAMPDRAFIAPGFNQAAVITLDIAMSAVTGVYRGIVSLAASSGGIAWAVTYSINVTASSAGARPDAAAPTLPSPQDPFRSSPSYVFNVKDFGATGNGQTDDTTALQTAICTAGAHTLGGPQGAYANSSPELFFPFGVYVITRPLFMECPKAMGLVPCTPANIRGEGTAIIVQRNTSADIFYSPGIWRWRVHGIQFVGGYNHIHIGNNDTDLTHVTISKSVFVNASSAAVRTIGQGGLGPEYLGMESSLVVIEDCQFLNNEQAAINWVDTMVVRDCWVEGSGPFGSMNKAIFENHDKLTLLRLVGVPQPQAGHNSRWIDNGPGKGNPSALLVARDCRFGGEAGGMTVVVNRQSFLCVPGTGYPVNASCEPPPGHGPLPPTTRYGMVSGTIVLDNCAIAAGGSWGAAGSSWPNATAIFLEQLPSQLTIENSNGLAYAPGDATIAGDLWSLVTVSDAIDLDGAQLEYAASAQCVTPQGRGCMRFEIGEANVLMSSNYSRLPDQLLPFVSGRVFVDAAPTAGIWLTGQTVHARPGSAAAQAGVIGWRCVGGTGGCKPLQHLGVWERLLASDSDVGTV